ncbi:MAG: DUF459 domain-containing protein [Rhizobiaceae bacterium]|nr:DUF459 domain-containing protein [Rhizobiaceae bacterium]
MSSLSGATIALMLAITASAMAADDLGPPPRTGDETTVGSVASPIPYIRPHQTDGELQAVVMGDSMADGMYAGLYRIMKDDARLKFVKKTKVNTGIVRSDRYDWNEAARQIAGEKDYDIAILVFGANDLQSIRDGGKTFHFKQPGWETVFNRRIDDIITSLKSENIAAYWIGLPITRKDRYQEDYAYVNGLFREAAERNGIRYVETWDAFADENGEFSAYGIGLNGKKIQLRADDGVHFTPDGYAKYASVVADVLRYDVAAAEAALAAKVAAKTE